MGVTMVLNRIGEVMRGSAAGYLDAATEIFWG